MAVSAVALLGLAGLQLQGMRLQALANYRGTAALLASDLADRMRANPAAASTLTAYTFTGAYNTGSLPGDPACGSSCSATQVAARDLNLWATDLTTQLPGAWGYVAANSGAYFVTVLWREPDQEVNASTSGSGPFDCPSAAITGSSSTELAGVRCYTIRVWP